MVTIQTQIQTQVTRGHNIVTGGWAGAPNPHVHPNPTPKYKYSLSEDDDMAEIRLIDALLLVSFAKFCNFVGFVFKAFD